jgi:hypothetical protein
VRELFLASFGAHDAGERLLEAALGTGVAPAEILYLCPSPRRIDQAKVEFLRLSGRDALVPPRFATLRQLARDVHDRQGSARRLPPELKPLLVQRVLTGEAAGRKPQASSARPATTESRPVSIGYARAVADFITQIRRYVPAQDGPTLKSRFESLLAGFEKPLARCLDALAALGSYEAELARLNWIDDEGIVAEAAQIIPKDVLPKLLVLDSFVAPDRLEADLIRALVDSSETTLALGYANDPADPDYAMANRFGSFVESLGGFETERLQGPATAQPAFYQYPDAEEEVKGICRDIIANGLTDAGDTLVAVPALAEYAPLFKRVFDAYDVPATVYPSTNLSASPPIVAVMELLRCIDTGYERLAAAAALSSPFLPGLMQLDDDPDSLARDRCATALNHYSCRAGIIKERRNWDKIRDRVRAAENDELEKPENDFLLGLEARIRSATRMMDSALGSSATPGEYAQSLKKLLGRAGFLSESEGPDDEQAELLEDRKTLYDILDALMLFEREFGAQRQSRSEFIKTLEYLIGLASRTPEPAPTGVTIVDMTETLGIHPRRLYFCGLTETNLPSAYTADPILPDRVRSALGMPDVDWHRDWQRFHFRRNLESSPNPPFLSFHAANQGQPVLPTPFITISPTPIRRSEVICSAAEEQLAQGRADGTRFADTALTADFSRDREVLATLGRGYGPARPISVTRLEQYRRCPYAFYIVTVLGMETPEEPTYDIDARQWGLVVHLVMEKLYSGGPVPVERIPDAATKTLDATLKEVELTRFWTEVTRRVFANLLPDIVRVERELRADGFEPGRTELSLRGNLTKDISLRGRFDRADTSGKLFRILDYKTGSPTNVGGKAVMDGTHLQLPLYAWLFQKENPQSQPDNFGVYSLREPGVIWFAGRKYNVQDMVDAAVANAIEVVRAIRTGRFPAEPGDKRACEYCNLAHTCGMHEDLRDS